jgi:hypothetical protein
MLHVWLFRQACASSASLPDLINVLPSDVDTSLQNYYIGTPAGRTPGVAEFKESPGDTTINVLRWRRASRGTRCRCAASCLQSWWR